MFIICAISICLQIHTSLCVFERCLLEMNHLTGNNLAEIEKFQEYIETRGPTWHEIVEKMYQQITERATKESKANLAKATPVPLLIALRVVHAYLNTLEIPSISI